MSENLSKEQMEQIRIRKSLEHLSNRFGSKWKVFIFGMIQGSGAVVGATVFVLIISFILGILGTFDPISSDIETVRETLNNARTN